MLDNENKQAQTKKKSGLSSRVVTMVLLTAAVLAVLSMILFPEELNLDAVKRWFSYLNVRNDGEYGSYTFDSHNSSRYAAMEDQLVLATVGGLYGYDDYGWGDWSGWEEYNSADNGWSEYDYYDYFFGGDDYGYGDSGDYLYDFFDYYGYGDSSDYGYYDSYDYYGNDYGYSDDYNGYDMWDLFDAFFGS